MSLSFLERRRGEDCLSDLTLDRLRTGELEGERAAAAKAHLEGCVLCTARRQVLTQEDERFAKEVWIQGEARRAQRRRPAAWWAGSVAAAAAMALIVAQPWKPGKPDSNLTKGGEALALVVRHPDGRTEDVLPGQALSPGDAVRMWVTARQPNTSLIVLDFDGQGSVSALEPSQGEPRRIQAGRQLLTGSVVLDGALGPERLVALFCVDPVAVPDAIAAGRRALSAANGDARAIGSLGLPCREASLLIHKEPRP